MLVVFHLIYVKKFVYFANFSSSFKPTLSNSLKNPDMKIIHYDILLKDISKDLKVIQHIHTEYLPMEKIGQIINVFMDLL
jgi:hypothetical protein